MSAPDGLVPLVPPLTPTPANAAMPWRLVLAAAAILVLTMGARQSLGLFIAPIHDATAIGIGAISFALAISQLVWGAAQPVYGALADRFGTRSVVVFGALLTIPLCWPLGRRTPATAGDTLALRPQLRVAFGDPNYLLLHLGFFTCGFHIAFLVTHLPEQVQLCGLAARVSANSLALIGLFNIAGNLAAGAACQRWRMKYVLAGMYASRAVLNLPIREARIEPRPAV